MVAAFLGTPIAGAILMAKNAKAMKNPKSAKLIVTIVTVGIVFSQYLTPIYFICSIGLIWWYKKRQATAFEAHIAQGGKKGSWAMIIGY